jgi:hypothetical protein
MFINEVLYNIIEAKKITIQSFDTKQQHLHSNLFSPELRCFAPVSAHPNFVDYFGGEFANIEVRWLISALYG